MIPRCFALAAVALAFINFAEALPVSSYEPQSLVDLPTSVDIGLPTSLPIPTESIPADDPITSLLPLPTLTGTAEPSSQTSNPISNPLGSVLSLVGSTSGAKLPLNQVPAGNLGDSSDSTTGSGLIEGILGLLNGLLGGPVDLQGHTEDGADLGGLGGLGGHNGGNLNL